MSGTEVAYFALQVAASYAISVLTAPDVEGPRLTDLAASGSSYGQPIPLAYGTVKLPGNVIWASDLIETKHTESAKGGPEITTYKYSQHLDVLVCAGPVTGVRRIWANGRLVFDISTTNTGAIADPAFGGFIQTAIARVISSLATVGSGIRVYVGDETQTADSLLEAYLGAGNVPGMRGYCHVVFENMQLADYGNRTPSLEFEVVGDGAFSRSVPAVVTYDGIYDAILDQRTMQVIWFARSPTKHLTFYDIISGTITQTIDISTSASSNLITYGDPVQGTFFVWKDGSFEIRLADGGMLLDTVTLPGWTMPHCMRWNAFDQSILIVQNSKVLRYRQGTGGGWSYETISTIPTLSFQWQSMEVTPLGYVVLFSDYEKKVVVLDPGYQVVLDYSVTNTVASGTWEGHGTYDPVRDRVYFCTSTWVHMLVVDLNAGVIPTVTEVAIDGDRNSWPAYHAQSDVVIVTGGGINPTVWIRDPDNLAVSIDSFGGTGYWPISYADGRAVEIPGVQDYVFHFCGDSGILKFQFGKRLSSNSVQLSAVVSDLCTRAGLATSDIDVTALTDMVDGYTTA